MISPDINLEGFGWNGSRTDVSYRHSVLRLRHRGLLFAGIFLAIALLPGGILVKEGFDYSTSSYALTIAAGLLLLVTVLYALYTQAVALDFKRGQVVIKKGFIGFVTTHTAPFSDILGIIIRKTEMTTRSSAASGVKVARRWETGLSCRGEGPTFDLYMTDTAESARNIAETLSEATGCVILPENDPFETA